MHRRLQIYKVARKDMDDIKIFTKKEKRTRNSYTNYENIQPRYRNRIWDLKMCHVNDEKVEKQKNGRNRTTKLGKYRKSWKKWKLQVSGNIWTRYHQTNRNERKRKKMVPQTNKKMSQKTNLCSRNLMKGSFLL